VDAVRVDWMELHWCVLGGGGVTRVEGGKGNAYCLCLDIQGVPGGKDLTSGECSLGQTIPI
jgi:hypothetical protein